MRHGRDPTLQIRNKSAAKKDTENTRHILFTFQFLECHALVPRKCSPLSYPLAVQELCPPTKLIIETQVQ
jgi:hypothetical protein